MLNDTNNKIYNLSDYNLTVITQTNVESDKTSNWIH